MGASSSHVRSAMRPTGERKDTNVSKPVRTEHDLLGDRDISASAYYGVHTSRALANFAISGHPVAGHPDLVQALAVVKQAAALANCDLGLLAESDADAIATACQEIRDGALRDQFVVPIPATANRCTARSG